MTDLETASGCESPDPRRSDTPGAPGRIQVHATLALGFVAALGVAGIDTVQADPSQLRLRDDFESDGFAPSGGLYFKDTEEQRAGAFRTQSQVVRSGGKALELSVSPRCRPDQRSCSERAEVWEKPEAQAAYDRTLWYAFSMKLDDPPPAAAHRFMVAQWKREIIPGADGDYSPFLGLRIVRGELAITIDSDSMPSRARTAEDKPLACVEGAAPAMQQAASRQTRLLVATSIDARPESFGGYNTCAPEVRIVRRGGALPKAEPRWIDFVFKVKTGPRGGGEIEIFANGAWVVSIAGRIGHEGPGLAEKQYFKFGPYRDGGQRDEWRVFYDAFRRGPNCEDVAGPAVCSQLKAS